MIVWVIVAMKKDAKILFDISFVVCFLSPVAGFIKFGTGYS